MKNLRYIVIAWFVLAGAAAGEVKYTEVYRIEKKSLTTEHRSGNLEFQFRWSPARGLHLKMVPVGSRSCVKLSLTPEDGELTLEPEEDFPLSVLSGSQFDLPALPDGEVENAAAVLKFRPETWAVYVEGSPVALFPAPFVPPVTVSAPESETLPSDEREAYFQNVDDFTFEDDFLRPEEAETDLPRWKIESGKWVLHTAADSAVEWGDIKPDKKRAPEPAFSPNFYSVKGSGTNAVMTSGRSFYDSYVVEVSLETTEGEMGVVSHFVDAERYYVFTVTLDEGSPTGLFRLRRVGRGKNQVLGAVRAPLTRGQWIRLGVKSFQNRMECRVDGVKAIDVTTELPVGGRFGLYADGGEGVRFDDVSARTNHDLDFKGVSELRRCTLEEHGRFFPRRRFFHIFPPRRIGNELEPYVSDEGQWLVLGSSLHGGHVFSASFVPERETFEVGLLSGYKSEEDPYYRFTCRRSSGSEIYVLEDVKGDSAKVLEQLRLPFREDRQAKGLKMMCDTAGEGEMRLYANGQMVLIHHPGRETRGASGLYVGPDTSVKISDPEYVFEREGVHHNQAVGNTKFIEDPFMRHWASPEGQWLETTNSLVWHKSDFFGRFSLRMPYAPGTEIHLGVEEGRTNGFLAVAAGTNEISLLEPARDGKEPEVLAAVETDLLKEFEVGDEEDEDEETESRKLFTIHYEGLWIWLTSGEDILLKSPLERPMQGTRIRLEGFEVEDLSLTRVRRYNVKDVLFEESLHEWTVNGGRWEVVNRFQCQPRWSHMNGQSDDNLAAIWSKYRFGGDFCVEMYAGIRHGWYGRSGDLNVTVMNDKTTPSRGYTVTCTEWDPDHSELYTTLYRNGETMARSDRYLIPRDREGRKRRGYTPWIKGGRDMHGAWYYIKIRRINGKLEYFFDNQKVFEVVDPDPLESGSVGIWTFMNSMVVARIKMAAEEIRRREPEFFKAEPGIVPAPEPPASARKAEYFSLLNNGSRVNMNTAELWEAHDPVGRGRLLWHEGARGPFFEFRNVLGSGRMLTRCRAEPTPYARTAGWEFDIKRTSGAKFNFHYSLGTRDDKGEYRESRRYFHRISGTDFGRGRRREHGWTEITAAGEPSEKWFKSDDWRTVRVILPSFDLRESAGNTGLLVRVEGFGNLQPSRVLQGVEGNGPGEAYAVAGFRRIGYGRPLLSFSGDAARPDSLSIKSGDAGDAVVSAPVPAPLQAWINATDGTGLLEAELTIRGSSGSLSIPLEWIVPPAEPEVACSWSADKPGAVDLVSSFPYPDRRFAFAAYSIEGLDVEPLKTGKGRLRLPLPRGEKFTATNDLCVDAEYRGGGKREFRLSWRDRSINEPPVLVGLSGPWCLFENFETRAFPESLESSRKTMTLEHFDPLQGTSLNVCNSGGKERLKAVFRSRVDFSTHPLFQFRYRGEGMVNVSFMADRHHFAHLSETRRGAAKVRYSPEFTADDSWHTWRGMVSDAVRGNGRLNFGLFKSGKFGLGSYARVDQTGRFTEWNVDDISVGPAVSAGPDLAFTPEYYDPDGVKNVRFAILPGNADIQTADWSPMRNGSGSIPDLSGLNDGLYRLCLRAEDNSGAGSAVTELPFLLDRKPLEIEHEIVSTDSRECNGSLLRVSFANDGGSPLDFSALTLGWGDCPVKPEKLGSSCGHSPESDVLHLNWPYIFREALNESTNHMSFEIVVSNIRDGAGNSSPDYRVAMTVDYESDDLPPTLLEAEYPANVLWHAGWETAGRGETGLKHHGGNDTYVVSDDGEPYLCTLAHGKKAKIWRSFGKEKWDLRKYPYLSFRIRRPDLKPEDKTRIQMIFSMGKKTKCAVLLASPGRKDGEVYLPEPVEWESNRWHTVTLNARELVSSILSEKEEEEAAELLEKPLVDDLIFYRKNTRKKEPLHLQGMAVYAPWSRADKVKLDAYDASGIAGTEVRYETESQAVEMSPAGPIAGSGSSGWMLMTALDKAGNTSVPVRIPFVLKETETTEVKADDKEGENTEAERER
ncbi:MAG: hypothetical protein R6V03_00945 [Kiritimatiellia bacterium]